jgi:hypothetical protein
MKSEISKSIKLDFQILGYYQIVGGGIGILLSLWSLLKAEAISTLTILLTVIILIFFLYSVFCGLLCLEFKNTAPRHSLVNQGLQVVGLYLAGFTFSYTAGVYCSFIIPLTNSSDITFGLGISRFIANINQGFGLSRLEINLFAIGVMAWVIHLIRKIEAERESKQIMRIGE